MRTVGKTGVTSAIVYQSMFTIKHPPKDMTLQGNVLWQDSGTFPAKLRQIVCGFVDRFVKKITALLITVFVQNRSTELLWLA